MYPLVSCVVTAQIFLEQSYPSLLNETLGYRCYDQYVTPLGSLLVYILHTYGSTVVHNKNVHVT